MRIENYIFSGGDNLNDPPLKTSGFSPEAELVYRRWVGKMGMDVRESENALGLPVDGQTRLFLRAMWLEKPGSRPVCFYIGFLLSRSHYEEAGEYYRLVKGLLAIPLDEVRVSASSLSPLEVSTNWSFPGAAVWTPFAQLKGKQLIGEDDYEENLKEIGLAISVRSMEDWFSQLIVALNPYRMNAAYTIVVSRHSPKPNLSESIPPSQFRPKPSPSPDQSTVDVDLPEPKREAGKGRTDFTILLLGLLLFSILVNLRLLYSLIGQRGEIKKHQDDMEQKQIAMQQMQTQIKELMEKNDELTKKNKDLLEKERQEKERQRRMHPPGR